MSPGVLGLEPDDERLRYAMLLAREADIEVEVRFSGDETEHPNTARILIEDSAGSITEVVGASTGGGSILITSINGLCVEFSGDYPTLIIRQKDVPGVINGVTSILGPRAGKRCVYARFPPGPQHGGLYGN